MSQGIAEQERVLLDIQEETRRVLRGALGSVGTCSVAMLDFPLHHNVGDTMIWLGEARYLSDLSRHVSYVGDQVFYSKLDVDLLPEDVPLLIHGGGNLGDIWPHHQAHREAIVSSFPKRKIVQMPQSVWFDSSDAASRANRVLGSHPDFLLLVREHHSLERARELLPDVRCEKFALTPRLGSACSSRPVRSAEGHRWR